MPACRKSLFSPLSKFSELHKSSENLGFQWRRETGEAPPVADQASLFRGRLPISGYKVSADWLEPTVYPFLGFPRTPCTRSGVCSIRKAAKPLTAALPYRRGEFTTLSTVSTAPKGPFFFARLRRNGSTSTPVCRVSRRMFIYQKTGISLFRRGLTIHGKVL